VASQDLDIAAPQIPSALDRGTRRRFLSSLGVVLSLALLWWLFRGVHPGQFIAALHSVSPWAIMASLGIVYLTLPLRAIQWQWLLGKPSSVGFWSAFKATCLGHLGNFLLPARGGEVLRAYLLARDSKLSFARIVPSVVLARIQDLPPILVLLLVCLNFGALSTLALGHSDNAVEQVELSIGTLVTRLAFVVAAAVVCLALAYAFQHEVLRMIGRVAHRVSGRFGALIEKTSADVTNALEVVGNFRYFMGAQLISMLCWAIFAVAAIPILIAFKFSLEQAVLIGIAQTAITSLTFVLPSAPGAIGTFHALCVAALYACVPSVDKDTAVAYAVVAHLVGTLGPGLPGVVLIPFLRVSLTARGE